MNSVDFLKWATNELKKMDLLEHPNGLLIINFLEQLHKVSNNDLLVSNSIVMAITRLLENKPLTPLTESDFYEVTVDGRKLKITDRIEGIYQDIDGKWYNDRAIAFSNGRNKFYLYDSKHTSKQQIDLPYYVTEQIVYLNESGVN